MHETNHKAIELAQQAVFDKFGARLTPSGVPYATLMKCRMLSSVHPSLRSSHRFSRKPANSPWICGTTPAKPSSTAIWS